MNSKSLFRIEGIEKCLLVQIFNVSNCRICSSQYNKYITFNKNLISNSLNMLQYWVVSILYYSLYKNEIFWNLHCFQSEMLNLIPYCVIFLFNLSFLPLLLKSFGNVCSPSGLLFPPDEARFKSNSSSSAMFCNASFWTP